MITFSFGLFFSRESFGFSIWDVDCRMNTDSAMCTVVTLRTSIGAISVELYSADAPAACQAFAELAADGKYNGALFDRVVADYLVEGGVAVNTPDYLICDDSAPSPRLCHVGAGVVGLCVRNSVARFYVTLSPQPKLDGRFAVLGRVFSGMAVLARMATLSVDEQWRPYTQVKITATDVQQLPRPARPLLGKSGMDPRTTDSESAALEDEVVCKKRRPAGDILSKSIAAVYGES
jgi:peptidyl-prolyl cis-trans isomerase-like 1